MSNHNLYFLIVAAGKGLRMGSKIRKQYLQINSVPILSHTLSRFMLYTKAYKIVLVVPQNDIEYCKENILQPLGLEKKVLLVTGGKKRQESVFNGIKAIKTLNKYHDQDIVLIHDGVRPFFNIELIESCVKGAIEFGACVPAIKATDTLKLVDNNKVIKTIDRDFIYQIQTPQAFLLKIIADALEYAERHDYSGTDDASIVEFYGHKVAIVKGLKKNIKITTQEDLKFAKAYLTI